MREARQGLSDSVTARSRRYRPTGVERVEQASRSRTDRDGVGSILVAWGQFLLSFDRGSAGGREHQSGGVARRSAAGPGSVSGVGDHAHELRSLHGWAAPRLRRLLCRCTGSADLAVSRATERPSMTSQCPRAPPSRRVGPILQRSGRLDDLRANRSDAPYFFNARLSRRP